MTECCTFLTLTLTRYSPRFFDYGWSDLDRRRRDQVECRYNASHHLYLAHWATCLEVGETVSEYKYEGPTLVLGSRATESAYMFRFYLQELHELVFQHFCLQEIIC